MHAEEALETVVVTAQRVKDALEAERALTPGAVTTLDAATFNERSVTQLADMLRYVPGVWAESYNGNDDVFYSSRGSNLDATDYDKNGVKFLQDGLPVTTADGNNHNRALDPLNARYVTVAHGANALAYGASTLGGAIDVTTPTARTSAPVERLALRRQLRPVERARIAGGASRVRSTDCSRPKRCSATAIASTAARTARACTPMSAGRLRIRSPPASTPRTATTTSSCRAS